MKTKESEMLKKIPEELRKDLLKDNFPRKLEMSYTDSEEIFSIIEFLCEDLDRGGDNLFVWGVNAFDDFGSLFGSEHLRPPLEGKYKVFVFKTSSVQAFTQKELTIMRRLAEESFNIVIILRKRESDFHSYNF